VLPACKTLCVRRIYADAREEHSVWTAMSRLR
jgi:hypothetical protein